MALLLAWLLYLAYIADVQYWYADFAPSSRYMLATLSFLMIAAAEGFAALPHRARVLAWIAAGWSALVTFGFALDPPLRHDAAADMIGTDGDGKFWTAVRSVFGIDPGPFFPSLFLHHGQDVLLTVVWCALLVAVVAYGSRVKHAG